MFKISLNVSFGSVASATFCCRIFGFACRLIASVMLSILFFFFSRGTLFATVGGRRWSCWQRVESDDLDALSVSRQNEINLKRAFLPKYSCVKYSLRSSPCSLAELAE